MDRFTLFEPLYEHSVSGSSWSESMIAWAVHLLGEDTDTASLRILAGLPRGSYEAEVKEYFAATLFELGQGPISDVERCLGEARVIAGAIVRGEVSPIEGVATIHSRAVSPLNHPTVLQPWCDLDSGFRTRAGSTKIDKLDGDALIVAITGFAEEFLSVDPSEQLQLIEADWSTGSI